MAETSGDLVERPLLGRRTHGLASANPRHYEPDRGSARHRGRQGSTMNEIVPLGPKQPSKADQPVSLALIAELSDIDRFKPLLVSRRLGWLTGDKEPRPSAVREAIADGEVVLANHAFKTFARELEAALMPASMI